MTMTTAIGWLRFDPKADSVESKPWWLILQCDRGWYHLYEPWMRRYMPGEWKRVVDNDRLMPDRQTVDREPRLALVHRFDPPAWGPHISVIRGEPIPRRFRKDWGKLNGRRVRFRYDPDIRQSRKHFWLLVDCPELGDIRESLGLPRKPRVRFHLTVAVIPTV